ncbi:MAG: hypothetical protein CMK59_08050 [Proteobacteria bacterium]|nr:hypothetical protein [Pseudomonadota bacterium]
MIVFLTVLVGCDSLTFRANHKDIEPALLYEAAELTQAPDELDQLVVLNYNIKYGGARLKFFWECNGDRYNMTTDEVFGHMSAIAEFINEHDPDLVLLQEVDRNSLRSDYMDQVQYLLDETALNFGAYASQHRVDFLPTDGMGHMDFGNAILSRWPIEEASRIALPLVEAYPAYYRYLYLKRHILTANISLPWDPEFVAINTHLEAFSEGDTKLQQIDKVYDVLSDLSAQDVSWVAGGDFNTLPNGSTRLSGFPDDCPGRFDPDDYSGEEEWMNDLFNDFNPAMTLEDYVEDEEAWYSYTGDEEVGWNRALDYVFSNGTWAQDGALNLVLQDEEQGGFETLPLSDHAPVQAVLEVQ